MTPRDTLISIFDAGVSAVKGRVAVTQGLAGLTGFQPDLILAVGKAAGDMCIGARALYGAQVPALVVTKYDHTPQGLLATFIESAHPVPDGNSLKAGRALLEAVSGMGAGTNLLLLVSGGASALAEVLAKGMSLIDLQTLSADLVASGADIATINTKRKEISLIKDGQLLATFKGNRVVIAAISDVEGDSIATIGSGIGDPHRCTAMAETRLVATNQTSRQACETQAKTLGQNVISNEETLYDDVFTLAPNIARKIAAAPSGILIFGGEPTIKLPANPGNGGRNQSLALALAKEISGTTGITILVAGTDGTDGPTDAAGAIIDGTTFSNTAQSALDHADAGTYLRQTGDILKTGPTGTNVMDLVIALKH